MTEIRYWGASSEIAGQSSAEKKKRSEAVSRFNQSLEMSLMSQMSGKDPFAGLNSSFMSGDITSQLMNIDIEGKEKVWAAQLSSPLGFFDNSFVSSGSSGSDTSALDSVVSLSVQAQMVKARDHYEKQSGTFSMQEFINSVAPDFEQSQPQTYNTLEQFISFIREEIEKASNQFGLEQGDLKKYLDL